MAWRIEFRSSSSTRFTRAAVPTAKQHYRGVGRRSRAARWRMPT